MSSYLSEAFKKLSFLKEEDFNLNDMEDIDDAKSFMDMPEDGVDNKVTIVDVDAPTEDDLLDSYVGKTILDCCVCHSKLYKNPEDVHIDEEGTLANIDEECPYCFSTDGYKVIGVVAPFDDEESKEEINVDDLEDGEEVKIEDEEKEEVKESFRRNRISKKLLKESKRLKESADILEYQKWVDYDMKKYHKISGNTMNKIKKAGFSVVKDQYGDYEVIADRKDEACNYKKKGKKKLKEDIGASYIENKDRALAAIKENGNKIPKYDDYEWVNIDDIGYYIEDAEDVYEAFGYRIDNWDLFPIWGYITRKDNDTYYGVVVDEIANAGNTTYEANSESKAWGAIYDDIYERLNELNKLLNDNKDESLKESIDDVTIGLDDQNVRLHSGEDDTTTITLTKQTDAVAPVPDDMKRDIEMRSEEENSEEEDEENGEDFVDVESEEETFEEEPVKRESLNGRARKRKVRESMDDLAKELDKKEDDKFVDVDVNEFDEKSFDELGESFLKNVYNNVKSFKTSNVAGNRKNIVIEGIIKFTSGNEKKTRFVFEAKDISKRGKVRFYGMNENFATSKRPFTISGKIDNAKFIVESMNYNYMTKVNGKSQRISGSVSLKEARQQKDLSDVKGSITYVLKDYISQLDGKTKEEIASDVEKIFKDNNIDTKDSRDMLNRLRRAKDDLDAMYIVTNSNLFGSGLGVGKYPSYSKYKYK